MVAATYEEYGIEYSGKIYDFRLSIDQIEGGAVCLAGVRGAFGDSFYGSHIVLIWKPGNGDSWFVRDPASPGNSSRPWTIEELTAADIFYSACIKGGHYGSTGIDISNWQKGINLDALAVDFAICKATQGASYVSPDCDRQMQQAMKRGLLVGVYHYVNGSGVDAEAQHFAGRY